MGKKTAKGQVKGHNRKGASEAEQIQQNSAMAANAAVPVEFRTSGSIVAHVIDADGDYKFVAIGARAADGYDKKGGRGAEIQATFSLKRGDKLDILVGAASTKRCGGSDSGGGGGTFVAINGRQNPLIVAGGGGGTRGDRRDQDGADASLDEAGGSGKGSSKAQGGVSGWGGGATSPNYRGEAGGGFFHDGAGGYTPAAAGKAFVNGGTATRHGGFGGGGGAGQAGGGGGGGYSGGGGGEGGGGGGSFVRAAGAADIVKKISDHAHGADGLLTITPPRPPGPVISAYTDVPVRLVLGVEIQPMAPVIDDPGPSGSVARFELAPSTTPAPASASADAGALQQQQQQQPQQHLPRGLSLDAHSGVISGAPLAATPATRFMIHAIGADGTAGLPFTLELTVVPPPPSLEAWTQAPITAVVGCPLLPSYPILGGGGAPARFAAVAGGTPGTSLPPGVTLDPGSGKLSGVPTAAGSFTIGITADNDGGAASAPLHITITVLPQGSALVGGTVVAGGIHQQRAAVDRMLDAHLTALRSLDQVDTLVHKAGKLAAVPAAVDDARASLAEVGRRNALVLDAVLAQPAADPGAIDGLVEAREEAVATLYGNVAAARDLLSPHATACRDHLAAMAAMLEGMSGAPATEHVGPVDPAELIAAAEGMQQRLIEGRGAVDGLNKACQAQMGALVDASAASAAAMGSGQADDATSAAMNQSRAEQEASAFVSRLSDAGAREVDDTAAFREQLAEHKAVFAAASSKLTAAHSQLQAMVDEVPAVFEELAAAEANTRDPRDQRDQLTATLKGASDPKEAKRAQLKIKRLKKDLDLIDDEIELGDATPEDKARLEADLAAAQTGDKDQRRALRAIASLAARALPELEVLFPAALSLTERWGHLVRREFGDYSGAGPLLPQAGGGAQGRALLKASIDGRVVVLKGYHADEKQLEREVEALKLLQHPNIITALGVCRHQSPTSGPIIYLELEHCSGGSLDTWVADSDPPPPRWRVLKVLRDALRGLRHVHSIRVGPGSGEVVLHRDVKPANILVDVERDRGVLADFNIAKVSSGATTLAAGAGTERFIAPEMADMTRGGAAVPASDLFSFGVTLVATLLPSVFRDTMPATTVGVMQVFAASAGDGDALATKLLAGVRPSDIYGEPPATAFDLEPLSGLVKQLLAVDPRQRPTAEAASEHPLFSSVQLHSTAPAPTTQPHKVTSAAGTCLTYRVRHGGETADAAATWESLHFNEAAVQFYLMLGGERRARVEEVIVCENERARERFEAKRAALVAAGKPADEIWVFHGTPTQAGIDAIISGGFKVGGSDGIPIANGAAHGNGVYSATGPATPMQSYAGTTSQVILARALPGRQGGHAPAAGVDMWRPRRDWAVFADGASLLPVYVVRFG